MDLWDLTRLLLRRWYFAVPMLLVTVGAVFFAAQSVSPDYKAMGYMQLIPAPSSGKLPDPDAKPRPANPWLDLGYAALGNAASLTVTDPTGLEALKAGGYSDSITVVMNERTPLFEIEAVGDSKEQATGTVQRVIKLLQDDIAAKQKQYGTLPEDTITTLVINDGSTPEQDSGTRKRVLIVAGGLGVLLTTAATIALDYWLRRRARGRDDGDSGKPSEPASGKAAPQPGPEPERERRNFVDEAEKTQVIRPQPRQSPRTGTYGGDRHRPETKTKAARSSNGSRDGAAGTNGNGSAAAEKPLPAVDSTIVLPTSHEAWRTQKKRQ